MSDDAEPRPDPDPPLAMGDGEPFARKRVGPAKFALAVLLAVLITAASFMLVAVILWAVQLVFHR